MPARALIFDFNGTLSDDEPILCEIFGELFAARGNPMSAQEYFDEVAGLSDAEIVRTWLGRDYPDVDAIVDKRIRRYRAAVADGSSIPDEAREAVRYAAARVPVAIVSCAAREASEPVLEAAGLAETIGTVVSADDVSHGQPDPAGYFRALELLDGGIDAREVVAIEDTEAGIAAAKGAGMRCLAVLGTLAPERLRAADEIVEQVDLELVRRLVG